MQFALQLLGIIAVIAGIGCWLYILIEAFKDELWKGFVGFLCGLYLLYYAIFDWEHDNKIPILLLAFGGNAVGAGLMTLAGNM